MLLGSWVLCCVGTKAGQLGDRPGNLPPSLTARSNSDSELTGCGTPAPCGAVRWSFPWPRSSGSCVCRHVSFRLSPGVLCAADILPISSGEMYRADELTVLPLHVAYTVVPDSRPVEWGTQKTLLSFHHPYPYHLCGLRGLRWVEV